MHIDRIDVFAYDLSYRHGEYVMSGGRSSTKQSSTLVRVKANEGLEGWAESCPLDGSYLPSHPEGIRASLQVLGPALLGSDPENLNHINRLMAKCLRGQYGAKSAIDIACWDLIGKKRGVPLSQLLGGVLSSHFPLYVAVPLASGKEMSAFVQERIGEGIKAFQVKVGNRPDEDIRRMEAVLEAASEDCTVIADANGGWDVFDARTAIAAWEATQIVIEQPCQETRACALAHQGSSRPLVLDESITSAGDLADGHLNAGAAGVNIKLSRVGGLTPARLLRDMAIGMGMKVTIEDTWGGDLATAAVSHLAASTEPSALLSVSFFNDWTQEHVAGYTPRSRDGFGAAPSDPGLGLEVDVDALGQPILVIS